MITALDQALRAEPELADLSGRFLFALDDGRGDVITTDFDLGYQARGPRGGIILIGSERVPVATEDAVPTMIDDRPPAGPRAPQPGHPPDPRLRRRSPSDRSGPTPARPSRSAC